MLLRKQSEIIAKQALYPEAPLFNIGAVIEIRGPFEVARIRLADQLLMRDPALCTALSMQGHAPEFVTLSQCPEIGFVDFSGQPDALAKAQVWIEESLQNLFPFDGKTRLMRHALVRAAHDLHFFVGNYHHVAYDGWATSLIYQGLITFYNNGARNSNNDDVLPPLSFEEQVAEETAYRASKTFVKDEAYWQERLSGYDTLLLSNGPASALQAKRHSFSLTPERYQQLRDLANHVNGTVFHVMIGLTVAHLCRTFGVDDIILGLPILNRRTARAKVTYGLFASVLPFRVQLSASATFTELLTTIGQQLKSDFRHQRFPASSLLPNGMPYEASLSYEKHDYSGVFEGTQTSLSVLSSLAQEYPLKVFVREYDDARPVRIDLDYNFEAFSALDEAAFLDGFERLVDELIDAPTGRVRGSRAIQSAVDAAPITADVTTDLCTQFETMVAQHGDAVAVSGDGVSLTYAQLDDLANRLAWRLREQGIGTGMQEDRVGLSVERGPALVIGILGILKAGGAYVPLDPTYPAERLHYLVSDSGIQAVVGDETGLTALSDAAQFTPILLDGETAAEAPPRHLHPQQAAYVIYTSGSTGQPKGCVVSHANVLRLFTATDHYGFGPQDVWSLFHSYAFDFSVWELWGALLHGGRVVVVPYLISRDPARFAALLEDEQVTVLSQTPAAFRQLLSVSDTRDYPALRLVTFGGEALVPSSLKRWYDHHGNRVRLVNMYGITETTVHVTEHSLRDEDLTQSTSVIGAPISDLSLQVLDRYGEPVPTGVAGELHVGGAGVTRGYLGRPGLTAQRFVPDAYGTPGARVYRSGDLGRRLPDGGLVYAGRADHQVKLRGFRIELGEIEAALRALNGVREAVVILDTPETGEPRLVGYVVGEVDASSLREALSQRLPVHMVPAILMPLETLPLTAHGKVDTKALPAPDIHVSAGQAPRTEVEKTLAAIWSDILNIPTPSIDDNFFSLGGDSINSLQIVAKARAAGIAITLEQLFASPMLRPLALKVDAQVVPDQAPVVVPFELLSASDRARLPDGLDDALPLSRLQGGMLFHSNLEAGGSIFHDVFSFTLRLPWDEQAWRDAIEQLPSRHAALRTSFHWTEYSEPLQLIHSTGHTDYQLVDLRHLSAEARAAAVTHFLAEARQRPFDHRAGGLLRIALHRHTDDQVQLTLDFHHAIMDGWSVATLLTDLILMAAGQPALPIPAGAELIADFVARERAAEADQTLQDAWRQRLADVEPMQWEAQTPEAATAARTVVRHHVPLPDALAKQVEACAAALGVSLKSVLLAVHLRVLAAVSGKDVVSTGYVTHGRSSQPDAVAGVGLFLNTLPLTLALRPSSWRALVQAVAAEERALQQVRQLPATSVKALSGGRTLYNVGFNFIHFHVYAHLQQLAQFELLDLDIFEETDFPLLAQYAKDPLDGSLALTLVRDPSAIDAAQVTLFAEEALNAFASLVAEYDAPWHTRAVPPSLPSVQTSSITTDLCTQFEAMAAQHGDAVAVSGDGASLTYAQLDGLSNRLAWRLREQGIGTGAQEDRVGLSVERGPALVIGILGILKAGGAYVPLDPAYPAERLHYLVSDSGIQAVVGDETGLTALSDAAQFTPILLDGETAAEAPPRHLHPQQAAYVIYTSGSTGQPKGCVVSHANVLRLFTATDHYGFGPQDVWSLFHSYAFDFSVWELWGALLHGGRVVVVPYLISRDPARFAALLEDEQVTVLSQTPAAFRQLLSVSDTRDYPALRLVTFGGEALVPSSIKRWHDRHGDRVRLVNMYGITETTVHVTEHTLRDEDLTQSTSVIGAPIADLSLQVLDRYGEPVPTGVAGELHVGGAGVTRGYLGRPGLTAQRFVPDAYGTPGARVYRSGDLGRRLPDGGLVYAGRADHQVKLRGFRIELGEIEAALRALNGVREAVVILDTPETGEPRLVGYVVGTAEPASLREALSQRLPVHMVPAILMPLEALPLTAHGKVDTKALPAPEADIASLTEAEAPLPGLEQEIATLLGKVLKRPHVGRHQNFFTLGGDSIQATQLMFQLREHYHVDLPLRTLFEAETVAALAVEIEALIAARQHTATDAPAPMKRSRRRGATP